MTIKPLDPHSEVVSKNRRWTPDWYGWLDDLCTEVNAGGGGGGGGDTTPDWVNCKDFGAVGDYLTDDTVAIQNAIDFAFANGIQTVYLPSGNYLITSALFIDPPTNLRVNLTSPPVWQFSMCFTGDEGTMNMEPFGTRIFTTVDDGVAIWLGTGQGMAIKNLQIHGPDPAYRALKNSASVGVGIAGSSAGPTRYSIENVTVSEFYYGFRTSANGAGSLGDSGTYFKCFANQCFIGYSIAGTQNFINSFYDCQARTTMGIVTDVGAGAHVFGGNWSSDSSKSAAFTYSGMSMSTALNALGHYSVELTCTISAPDIFVNTVYNTWAIVTDNFGIVPCIMSSWNPATGVATFTCLPEWAGCSFPEFNPASSELEADLQTANLIYAAERATTFTGANISVIGIHVENPSCPTMLINCSVGFGSSRPNYMDSIFFNFNPALPEQLGSSDPAHRGRHYIASSHPFINVSQSDLSISNSEMGSTNIFAPCMVHISTSSNFKLSNIRAFLFNMRQLHSQGAFLGAFSEATGGVGSMALGSGQYDRPFHTSRIGGHGNAYSDNFRKNGWGQSEYWGVRPAATCSPGILHYWVSTLAGALPAINSNACPYPILWGGQQYKIIGEFLGTLASGYNIISSHHFYSYGQDLNQTNLPGMGWRYKGKSFCVYNTGTGEDQRFMFPGLGVLLNDGTSEKLYIVTGVFPFQGYFTVQRFNGTFGGGEYVLSGASTSMITGNEIGQEPYAITQF